MVDTARAKAPLRDLEAAAFAQQHVGDRHADVLQFHFHVAVRRIIITEHRQVAQDGDARRVHRHQDHRLLRVALRFEIGLAHHDGDLAPRIAHARRPPFAAIDHIFIAIAFDAGFDIGRIRTGGEGFGHQEGRPDLAVHQRFEPFVLLFARAIAMEYFHIARVGRGTVEDFGCKTDAAHFLGAQRIFEIGEAGAFEFEGFIDMMMAVVARRHEQVPDALILGLGLQIFDHLDHLPAFALRILFTVGGDSRADMVLDEIPDPVAPVGLPFGRFEIHRGNPLSFVRLAGKLA